MQPRNMKLPFGTNPVLSPVRTVYAGPYRLKPESMYGIKMAAEIDAPSDLWVPIRDYGVPKDDAMVAQALGVALDQIARGREVYVGCMGGLGRTGLFLALLAKAMGMQSPVSYVREQYDGHAVETDAQEHYVKHFDLYPAGFSIWKARGTATLCHLSERWKIPNLSGGLRGQK